MILEVLEYFKEKQAFLFLCILCKEFLCWKCEEFLPLQKLKASLDPSDLVISHLTHVQLSK